MNTALSSQLNRFDRLHSPAMGFVDLSPSTNTRNGISHRIYQRREALFSAGDTFEGVYQLRSGSAKASICSASGDEYVTEFHYPGDIIGIDGFDTYQHSQNLRFLETSSLVCIKESDISQLLKGSDGFGKQLLKAMSHCIVCEQKMLMSITTCTSEQRVALFLLQVSKRFHQRGCSAEDFNLSMTRTDIASYLGMAIETLSRTLTLFQHLGLIKVSNRDVKILNYNALKTKARSKSGHVLVN